MEDLDQGRVRAGIAEQQLEDLRSLGLDWDGPGRVPVAPARALHRRDRAPARGGPAVRVLLHAGGDPRGRVGAARAAARGLLPRHLPAADALPARAQARRRAATGAARARRDGADRVHRPADGPAGGPGRRLRAGAQRRRAGLPARGGGRRRRAGHRRGRARRRPARLDAAPAVPGARCSGCPSRRSRTSRSCSAPTARGWPSATAR